MQKPQGAQYGNPPTGYMYNSYANNAQYPPPPTQTPVWYNYQDAQTISLDKPQPPMATQAPPYVPAPLPQWNNQNPSLEKVHPPLSANISPPVINGSFPPPSANLISPATPEYLPTSNVAPSSKFICYVVPFPPLKVSVQEGKFFPTFMVYTLPPQPLPDPTPGQKEGRLTKSKRKWEKAKADAKSKGGIKSTMILGLDSAMSATKNTRVEMLSRCPKEITEFELHYPPSMDPQLIQQMFNQMLEMTQKGAKRNVYISTILLPITFTVDLFCIFWPLPGPFFPVDAVWAFASYQAMNSSNTIITKTEHGEIKVTYKPNPGILSVAKQLEYYCLGADTKSKIFFTTPTSYPTLSADLAHAVGYDAKAPIAVLNPETGLLTSAPQLSVNDIAEDICSQLKKSAKEYYSFVKSNQVK